MLSGSAQVSPGAVTEIDPIAGQIMLKRAATSSARHPVVESEAIRRFADWRAVVCGIEALGRYGGARSPRSQSAPKSTGSPRVTR